jgi:hypothetical protein
LKFPRESWQSLDLKWEAVEAEADATTLENCRNTVKLWFLGAINYIIGIQ